MREIFISFESMCFIAASFMMYFWARGFANVIANKLKGGKHERGVLSLWKYSKLKK